MVTSPQEVKLTEVHVRWNPARFVGLRCLAASLTEQASVSRTGAGALRLGVGGLEGGCGALTAGERGRTEEGGGERWLVMDSGGGDGHEGGNRRGNESERGEERVRDTKERGGQRERTGGRRGGGKRQEGSGERETRHRGEGAKRDFNYGLQDVHTRFAGSYMELAKEMEQGEGERRKEQRTCSGCWQVGGQ